MAQVGRELRVVGLREGRALGEVEEDPVDGAVVGTGEGDGGEEGGEGCRRLPGGVEEVDEEVAEVMTGTGTVGGFSIMMILIQYYVDMEIFTRMILFFEYLILIFLLLLLVFFFFLFFLMVVELGVDVEEGLGAEGVVVLFVDVEGAQRGVQARHHCYCS